MSRRLGCSLCLLLCSTLLAQDATERRRQSLEVLIKNLIPSRSARPARVSALDNTWEDWVKRTGELPPDFDSMPSIAELPDPLMTRENGKLIPVANLEQWKRQRQWIRSEFEHSVFGKMPPPPQNMRAVVTETHRQGAVTVRKVRLEFGPDHRASLRLELVIPDGKGPFPVFLTNHPFPQMPWISTAVRRGYIACSYVGQNPKYGNGDDSDAYLDIYPEYDFSCLARWAWAGLRAVDYLYTLPEVDKTKIGMTGHSQQGKQALLAAAFDERIAAVVPSSGNTGENNPWRYTTAIFATESIQDITTNFPHWFHPRLRFFTGREDKLPVDQNMLLALVAPRPLMIYSAYSESEGNPLGIEQVYRSVLPVYRFLGREQNLWLHLRAGEHETFAGDIEDIVDFFDAAFARKPFPKRETWIHGYTFDNWRRISGEKVDIRTYPRQQAGDYLLGGKAIASPAAWNQTKRSIRKRISWVLGEEPPGFPIPPISKVVGRRGLGGRHWLSPLLNRPVGGPEATAPQRRPLDGMGDGILPYGDDLRGDLFYPLGSDGKPKAGKWPVVIWLHPYSYHYGWSAGYPWTSKVSDYMADLRPSFGSLTGKGFAVFAFDQLGFGTRILDGRQFYQRYPRWSLMGKMMADTRAAIDALAALDEIDSSRIYLLGYSLGGKLGLLTAAFDERVAGVASVCGFDPLRLSTPDKGTEGIGHYSHLHGLIPRLGFFVGQEARVPFDYDEVVSLIAPRPVLLIAPTLDRYARIADVRSELEAPKKVYSLLGREDGLQVETPVDFNRFPRSLQEKVFDWLANKAR